MPSDTAHVIGASKLARRIRSIQAGAAVALTGPGLENLLLKRTKERYRKEIDPTGKRWKALSPITVEDKAKRGKNKHILMRDGLLYNSIAIISRGATTLASPTGAGFSIGVINSNDGEYGADPAVYGRVHQFGSGKVKQRRFLGISKLDIKAVDSLFRREIIGKARLG